MFGSARQVGERVFGETSRASRDSMATTNLKYQFSASKCPMQSEPSYCNQSLYSCAPPPPQHQHQFRPNELLLGSRQENLSPPQQETSNKQATGGRCSSYAELALSQQLCEAAAAAAANEKLELAQLVMNRLSVCAISAARASSASLRSGAPPS